MRIVQGLFLMACLSLASCAQKRLSKEGMPLEGSSDAKLSVTVDVVKEFSDDYNVLLQVNLESLDGRWIRVDQVEVEFPGAEKTPHNMIVGRDLVTWAESKADERMIRRQNEDMFATGVAATGAALFVIGALNRNQTIAGGGATTVGAGSVYQDVKNLQRVRDEAQQAKLVPESHLLSPFSVPSMSLVKRWLLINTPTGYMGRNILLRLKTVEGEVLSYEIRLRS